MKKRLLCIILAALLIAPCMHAGAADTQMLVNETFEDYITNASVDASAMVTSQGSKVIEHEYRNKAIGGSAEDGRFLLSVPVDTRQVADTMVFSIDLKIDGGSVQGTVFPLSTAASLMTFTKEKRVQLEDGYPVGGYAHGWHTYAAVIDYAHKTYDFYIDGKLVAADWSGKTTPAKPSKIEVVLSGADGAPIVYADNIRFYASDTVIDKNKLASKPYNEEALEYTPIEKVEAEDIIYIDNYADKNIAATFQTNGSKDSTAKFDSFNGSKAKYFHFNQVDGKNIYANLQTDASNLMNFVYEISVYPVKRESARINIGYAYVSGSYSRFGEIQTDGRLTVSSTTVGNIPLGEWTKISVVVDMLNRKGDWYINGVLAKKGLDLNNGGTQPETIRIGIETTADAGTNEVYFNCVKLYSGSELKAFDDEARMAELEGKASASVSELDLSTVMETADKAAGILRTDSVFMAHSDYYYTDGERRRYSDFGHSAYADENGVVMVSSKLLADVFGVNISCDGSKAAIGPAAVQIGSKDCASGSLEAAPVLRDGILYLPVHSVAKNILGKYSYADERGFVIVSDQARNYVNVEATEENLESSDVVYRYMLYDNPTGEEIYESFLANSPGAGTRLLVRADEIQPLRQKVQNSSELRKALSELLVKCEEHIAEPPYEQVFQDDIRTLDACIRVSNRISDLYVAYVFTDDSKYLDRMWKEARYCLVEWPDWNLDAHFLDSGKLAPGIAMAWDALRDYLSESDKKLFTDKITEKYIDYCVGVYTGDSKFKGNDYRVYASNWGAVVGSGMLMTALSFMDSENPESELNLKCKYIAENTIKALEYPMDKFYPAGATKEGVHYHTYYVEHIGLALKSLMNVCGTDYGFLRSPGLENASKYALYTAGFAEPFNYADQHSAEVEFLPEFYLFPSFYGNDAEVQTLSMWAKSYGHTNTGRNLLWYTPPAVSHNDEYPLDAYFRGVGIAASRSEWADPNASYLAMIGGYLNHHFDKGGFIFEKDGVRWFEDLGADNYNVDGGYSGTSGHTLYRKRAEGHNVMVINPSKENPGQVWLSDSPVIRQDSKPRGAITVYDLSEAYAGQVTSYNRGFYLGEDRSSLIVQDELELTEANSDVYSFFHTKCGLEISPDGKSAKLIKDDKVMNVSVICDAADWRLEARDCEYFFPEMARPQEFSRSAYKKLTLVAKASGKLNVSYKFTMENDGYPYAQHELSSINSWQIPDGEARRKPKLEYMTVNGQKYDGFSKSRVDYEITVNNPAAPVVIGGYSPDGTVSVKQPADYYDNAVITVTSPDGLFTVYTVSITYVGSETTSLISTAAVGDVPANMQLLNPVRSVASHNPQEENSDRNAIDGDTKTYWASNKSGAYITVDLGASMPLSGVAMSWSSGSSRYYIYDILVSDDGVNFTKLYSGTSLKYNGEYEFLPFSVSARYVRYVGYGHKDGAWNSLAELRPCMAK